jgi:hypothetical protein
VAKAGRLCRTYAAYLLLFDARHELRWRAFEPLSEASWRASRVAVEQTVARP